METTTVTNERNELIAMSKLRAYQPLYLSTLAYNTFGSSTYCGLESYLYDYIDLIWSNTPGRFLRHFEIERERLLTALLYSQWASSYDAEPLLKSFEYVSPYKVDREPRRYKSSVDNRSFAAGLERQTKDIAWYDNKSTSCEDENELCAILEDLCARFRSNVMTYAIISGIQPRTLG